jgi:hypothetical protein
MEVPDQRRLLDAALVKFATRYADQAEHDHAALLKAIRSGRVKSH